MPGAYPRVLGTRTHRNVNIEARDHLGSIGGCDPGVTQATEECPQLFVRGRLSTLRVFRSFVPEIIGVDHLGILSALSRETQAAFEDGLNEMVPQTAGGANQAGPCRLRDAAKQ